jgi:hypothetical protein
MCVFTACISLLSLPVQRLLCATQELQQRMCPHSIHELGIAARLARYPYAVVKARNSHVIHALSMNAQVHTHAYYVTPTACS